MGVSEGEKRGFLRENFRVFHLKDSLAPTVDYHYHEFDKIVLHVSGNVSYYMEGIPCRLTPGDVLFVPHDVIHKPVIDPSEEYERYVIWAVPEYLLRLGGEPLTVCFDPHGGVNGFLRHTAPAQQLNLLRRLEELTNALGSQEYMAPQLAQGIFFCLMVQACQLYVGTAAPLSADKKIRAVMDYIEAHLGDELNAGVLGSIFYVSSYHLMRLFKAETGYTLHQYITRRRVLAAAALIGQGVPAGEAAGRVGYSDYSTFLRAFKSVFKTTPRSFSTLSVRSELDSE